MKDHLKLSSVITVCYLITLCIIYKYIPRLEYNTYSGINGAHHHLTNNSDKELTEDKFKLHWRANEKVYFKKVKDVISFEKTGGGRSANVIKCGEYFNPTFQQINKDVYVYSAYLDTRNGTRYIRMVSAINKKLTKQYINSAANCVFNETLNNGTISPVVAYEMCENHKRLFGGWILSCIVPDDIRVPQTQIGIYFNGDNIRNICVTVENINIQRRKLDFGVCVPPLYGEVKPKALIEFIEFNRILGADVFILYVNKNEGGILNEIRKIVAHYGRQNIVIPISWDIPFPPEHIWYYGQSLAINDCLYRNMNRFKYLAFIDLDEFIIPQGNLVTWNNVIDAIRENVKMDVSQASGFTFKSTFFSPEFSRHVFSNEMSVTVRTNRTQHFSYRRNKIIVQPERIFELGIHHVSKPYPDSSNTSVIDVPTTIAHIHHYRTCIQEFGIHCQVRIKDFSVPNKYGQRIIDNYLKTVSDIIP
jgi:hypothetical protein